MPPAQKTNLYLNIPGQYIYLLKNGRYSAFKRFPDPTFGPYQPRKKFNKSALFYTLEDAITWLESLPEIMERPYRYDNADAPD